MSKTSLFQAIQFSQTVLIQTVQFSISMQLVLFDPLIGPYQVLPFQASVNLGAMAMKGCSAFPKPQHHWNLTIRLLSVISRTLVRGGSYLSAVVQSVYSTAQPTGQGTNVPSSGLWGTKLVMLNRRWMFTYLTMKNNNDKNSR